MFALIIAVSILVCVVVAMRCLIMKANENANRWERDYNIIAEQCDNALVKKHDAIREKEATRKDLRIRTEERDIAYATIINVRKQVAQ